MFYVTFKGSEVRTNFISMMKEQNINPVFHYLSLHKSDFYKNKHDGRNLPNADTFSETLVRLPLFVDLSEDELNRIKKTVSIIFA